jgi:SNF family Na+-dependent transporter
VAIFLLYGVTLITKEWVLGVDYREPVGDMFTSSSSSSFSVSTCTMCVKILLAFYSILLGH